MHMHACAQTQRHTHTHTHKRKTMARVRTADVRARVSSNKAVVKRAKPLAGQAICDVHIYVRSVIMFFIEDRTEFRAVTLSICYTDIAHKTFVYKERHIAPRRRCLCLWLTDGQTSAWAAVEMIVVVVLE